MLKDPAPQGRVNLDALTHPSRLVAILSICITRGAHLAASDTCTVHLSDGHQYTISITISGGGAGRGRGGGAGEKISKRVVLGLPPQAPTYQFIHLTSFILS